MKSDIESSLIKAAHSAGIQIDNISLDYPENPEYGDFSTNIALSHAKKLGVSPRALADKILEEFNKIKPNCVISASIAGAGFINFFLSDESLAKEVLHIAEKGLPVKTSKKKIMVEYTDPNPFKEFHIGHLMANAIGESISRLIESDGTAVIRANWQGDVGPHVAKAVWGAMQDQNSLAQQAGKIKNNSASFWGQAYSHGSEAYDNNEDAKKEIDEINKKIYSRSDPEINKLYERGRKESLDAFEVMYKRLDTKFDHYFFEGTEGRNGESIVREFQKKGVFEESQGAIIFPGEKYGLHTRVFITSHGLPTYETKELGLNTEKFKLHPDLDQSIIVTGNEQTDYFRVLLKVFEFINPEIAKKTRHISHGLLRFASGKMSSRKGSVVPASQLIGEISNQVKEKAADRDISEADIDAISIGAIKYTILRTSVGSDIVFDSAKSISFEGDSGPYLQYAAVRAATVLEKGKKPAGRHGKEAKIKLEVLPEKVGDLEKLLSRFGDIVDRARAEFAPQIVANYLINLAGAFNNFYATEQIISETEPLSPYRLALTQAFLSVMTRGLWVLGIKVPSKM